MPSLKLHTHLLFEGKQTSYNTDLKTVTLIFEQMVKAWDCQAKGDEAGMEAAKKAAEELAPYVVLRQKMPARAIVNLGGEYTLGRVMLGLNIYNLLGTRYNRSGMNTNLIPQQGRWFLASIGIKI